MPIAFAELQTERESAKQVIAVCCVYSNELECIGIHGDQAYGYNTNTAQARTKSFPYLFRLFETDCTQNTCCI